MALKGSNKKEYQRDYMKRKRSNIPVGLTDGSNTYPAIIHALADPVKREKLRRICQSLKEHNALEDVYYGVRAPVPMNVVADFLVALT